MSAFGDRPRLSIGAIATVNPRRDAALRTMDDRLNATFVPMAAVDETSGTIANPEVKVLGELRKGFTPFRDDDVIFAKITPCMENGKSAVARGLVNGLGFGSTEFHVIRCGPRVLPEWVWYFLRQRSVKEEARRHFRGSAGQQRVPADFLKQLAIPIPGVEEQRRIVRHIKECMERVDEVQALRHKAHIEAQSLLPSVLNDVERRYGWSRLPIGCVLTGTRNGRSVRASSDGANGRVLTLTAVRGVNLDVDACKAVRLDQELASKYQVHANDVFVSRSNTRELVGLSSIAAGPVPSSTIYPDLLIKLQPDTSRVVPRFLAFILRCPSVRKQIQDRATGTSQSMVKISGRRLREVMIPLPSPEEQRQVLATLDEALEVSNQILSGLQESVVVSAREAVLRRAFAGGL